MSDTKQEPIAWQRGREEAHRAEAARSAAYSWGVSTVWALPDVDRPTPISQFTFDIGTEFAGLTRDNKFGIFYTGEDSIVRSIGRLFETHAQAASLLKANATKKLAPKRILNLPVITPDGRKLTITGVNRTTREFILRDGRGSATASHIFPYDENLAEHIEKLLAEAREVGKVLAALEHRLRTMRLPNHTPGFGILDVADYPDALRMAEELYRSAVVAVKTDRAYWEAKAAEEAEENL